MTRKSSHGFGKKSNPSLYLPVNSKFVSIVRFSIFCILCHLAVIIGNNDLCFYNKWKMIFAFVTVPTFFFAFIMKNNTPCLYNEENDSSDIFAFQSNLLQEAITSCFLRKTSKCFRAWIASKSSQQVHMNSCSADSDFGTNKRKLRLFNVQTQTLSWNERHPNIDLEWIVKAAISRRRYLK